MSSHVTSAKFSRLLGLIDLTCAGVMLTYPALFAELVYPQLTPHGIILAIKLLGWWRLGRGLCTFSASRYDLGRVAGWLWLACVPMHCAALGFYAPELYTSGWHVSHLVLAMWAGRTLSLRPQRRRGLD